MNKKLLILLALIAALALTFIACNTTPDEPEDTTVATDEVTEPTTTAPAEDETDGATEPTEETTEAEVTEEVTTEEVTTEEVTTEEVTTEEVTTEEVTTEEVTTEEPEPEVPHYDNYTVPQDQWTVSGHCPQIVLSDGHANSGMVAAGGVESGALLHQGAIGLGEIDLSTYSKVVVYFGVDNSDVTLGRYNENANNRIMLTTADTNNTNSPAEENIIASATYEPCGWAVMAFEIDLTGIDYNGPVYVTYDTLPGTFMLFSAVEFIGAEIPAEEVVEPVDIDLNSVTVSGSWPNLMDGPSLGLEVDTMVAALHYGSINLGEMDLSQYSKVTVTYCTPCGELNGSDFNAEYGATGKRVLLLNAPSAVQDGTKFEYLPAEEAIITTQHYDMSSAAGEVMTVEIDLTAIDYNGQLYLTFDARNAENAFGAIGYLVYVIGITFA